MRGACRLAALVLVLSAAGSFSARSAGTVLELQGRGFQIYACQTVSGDPVSGAFAWRLKAPDASLQDAFGREIGRHFAGPSWRAQDGSIVVGEVLVSSPAPQLDAIPWLLLRAKSHAGEGLFASIDYIARIHTQGGLAPAPGCDRAHVGDEARVPYQASYLLFPRASASFKTTHAGTSAGRP